jgi:hypothetical protein
MISVSSENGAEKVVPANLVEVVSAAEVVLCAA